MSSALIGAYGADLGGVDVPINGRIGAIRCLLSSCTSLKGEGAVDRMGYNWQE